MRNNHGIHTFSVSFQLPSGEVYSELQHELFEYSKKNNIRFIPNFNTDDLLDDTTEQEIDKYILNVIVGNLRKKQENPTREYWIKRRRTLSVPGTGLAIQLEKSIYCEDTRITHRNYYIRYFVNPSQIMGNESYNIYQDDDFIEVCQRVDSIISSVDDKLPKMQDTSLRRIDFCHDITLGDPNKVRMYINLLKKYRGYKGFKIVFDADEKGNRYPVELYTSLRRGATELYVYDKYAQMKGKNYYSAEDRKEKYGVLRVELRFYNAKIYYEKRKRGLKLPLDFLNQSGNISNHGFDFYLRHLFHMGEYHTYVNAIAIIDKSKCSKKIKNCLRQLIQHISEKHNLIEGINSVMKWLELDRNDIKYLLNALNRLNVNPVTISRRDSVSYGYDHLPNLLTYFKNED